MGYTERKHLVEPCVVVVVVLDAIFSRDVYVNKPLVLIGRPETQGLNSEEEAEKHRLGTLLHSSRMEKQRIGKRVCHHVETV